MLCIHSPFWPCLSTSYPQWNICLAFLEDSLLQLSEMATKGRPDQVCTVGIFGFEFLIEVLLHRWDDAVPLVLGSLEDNGEDIGWVFCCTKTDLVQSLVGHMSILTDSGVLALFPAVEPMDLYSLGRVVLFRVLDSMPALVCFPAF